MEASELACHVSAGVVAGAAVEATLYPIDTIKTRLQAARGGAFVNLRNLYKGSAGISLVLSPPAQYSSLYTSQRNVCCFLSMTIN